MSSEFAGHRAEANLIGDCGAARSQRAVGFGGLRARRSTLYVHQCADPAANRTFDTRLVYVWKEGEPRLLERVLLLHALIVSS